MSIKKLFGATNKSRNYLAETNEKKAFKDVESAKNMQEIAVKQDTFSPQVDFSEPANFAKFGSAYLYYKSAMERIVSYYPYDGSDYEFNKFYNKSLDIEKYIFNNLYPRTNGYANFDSSSYIDLTGGPHSSSAGTTAGMFVDPATAKREYSNIYDTSIYTTAGLPTDYGDGTRESNLKANFDTGVTVEFWLKSKDLPTAANSIVFDMWNNNASGTVDSGRLTIEVLSASSGTPFLFTAQSGTMSGTLFQQSIGQTITSTTLDSFNHYAFVFQNSGSSFTTKLYLNGYLNDTTTNTGRSLGELHSKEMQARIGSLITVPFRPDAAASTRAAGTHTLTGSVDELRYWKTSRTADDIGRNWFTHVRGGTNTDISNTTLGVYYKFNEGTSGDNTIDSRVLDYSGRLSNGSWFGTPSRTLSSAMVEASASTSEFKDPIIYSTHPDVSTLKAGLLSSGSYHDSNNNASFHSLIPSWIMEEHENIGNTNPETIAHIVGSYFDKIHMQISAITTFKQLQHTSASYSPLFMAQHLPQSLGLATPELFIDTDVISKFLNKTNDFNFESDLTETKNLIYQNLYNNLSYIYKAKGTEKAIRNIFRCFYLDDKIIKFNTYADNTVYDLKNNLQQTVTNKNSLNFNSGSNYNAVVFQKQDPDNTTESRGYISGSGEFGYENIYGLTSEVDVIFPSFRLEYDTFNRNFTDVSIYGMHSASVDDPAATTTYASDVANFQVSAVRDAAYSHNVYFKLTSSISPHPFGELTSSIFLNTYDNEEWNLSVRLRPSNWPLTEIVSGSDVGYTYDVIFQGVSTKLGNVENSFVVSSSVSKAVGHNFLNASKRLYIGAERTNITGAILNKSDVLVTNARYWSKYIDDLSLRQHIYDVENVGISGSYKNISPIDSNNNNLDILNLNTLVLDWSFNDVTASDSGGNFFTQDMSSGSAQIRSSLGWLGKLSGYLHSGYGYGFAQNTTNVVDKRSLNTFKFVDPEQAISSDMIQILSEDDKVFGFPETIPNYFHTLEKSLSSAISDEMLNFFAGVVDFNNLIGAPVNRYRQRYKAMEKLREAFYRKVTNTTHVEDYIKYYQWFDDALSEIVSQFIPASGKFTDGVMNVIESHVLERNKYKSQFPTIEFKADDPISPAMGINEKTYNWKLNHHPVSNVERDNSEWWLDRAKRVGSAVISSGDSDADAVRDIIRETIENDNNNPTTRLSTLNQGSYLKSNYVVRRLSKPYKLSITRKSSPVSPIRGGVNFEVNKKFGFAYNALYPAGPVNHTDSIYVPENVLFANVLDPSTGIAADLVRLKDSSDPQPHPHDKVKRRVKVQHGRDWYNGDHYQSVKSDIAFPFNIISSSVATGYNKLVVEQVTASIEITNLHNDVYGSDMEVPMQGPFTNYAVGGHQSRHVKLNAGADDYTTRPEAWKILLGHCGAIVTGAIGMVGADYPWPEGNAEGENPYPMTASQKAVYYRDFTAKRPVNIKNIHHTTGSTILGNYNHNYDVVQAPGGYANPRQFVDNQPNLPTTIFNDNIPNVKAATSVRTLLDIYRGARDGVFSANTASALIDGAGRPAHFDYSADYSTAYLESTTNNSVIISRFSAPGGVEVMSKGYQDFKSGEFSVYNGLNNRNLTVKRPWQHHPTTSGTTESDGTRVYDIHGSDYGYSVHATRHAERFFRDSILVPSNQGASYDEQPSFHKVHRNNVTRPKLASEVWNPVISGDTLINDKALYFTNSENYGHSLVNAESSSAQVFLTSSRNTGFTYTGWVRIAPAGSPTGRANFFAVGKAGANAHPLIEISKVSASFTVEIGTRSSATYGGGSYSRAKWSVSTTGSIRAGEINGAGQMNNGEWVYVAVSHPVTTPGRPLNSPAVYFNGIQQIVTTTTSPYDYFDTKIDNDFSYLGTLLRRSDSIMTFGHDCASTAIQDDAFTGSMDQLTLWTAALNAGDITTLYNDGVPCDITGSSVYTNSGSYLFGWYKLGEGNQTDLVKANINGQRFISGSNAIWNSHTAENHFQPICYTSAILNALYLSDASTNGLYPTPKEGCTPTTLGYSASLVYNCSNVYDNLNQYHPIPRSDRQYAWMTGAILDPDPCNYRYSGFMPVHGEQAGYYSASSGYEPWMMMISASEFGSYVVGTNRIFGKTLEDTVTGSFNGFVPTDFVGLNTHIYEPIAASTNILGYPAGTPLNSLSTTYEGQYRNKSFVNLYISEPSLPLVVGPLFNSLMLKRNGPYGWGTFNQMRQGNHPVLRNERSSSQLSVYSSTGMANYNLPAVSMRGRPAIINYSPWKVVDSCGNPVSNDSPTSITLKSTDNNQKIFFNSLSLNNINGTDPSDITTPFDHLILSMRSPVYDENYLIYTENIYPSIRNEFVSSSRQRTGYDNLFWRDSRSERGGQDMSASLAVPTLGSRLPNTSMNTNAGHFTNQSSWILDAQANFLTRTGSVVGHSLSGAYGSGSQRPPYSVHSPGVNYLGLSGSAGELQNDYTIALYPYVDPSSPGISALAAIQQLRAGALYSRKHMMGPYKSIVGGSGMRIPETGSIGGISASYDSGQNEFDSLVYCNTGEALWEAGEHAGIVVTNPLKPGALYGSPYEFKSHKSKPWYDSYADFRDDIRLMAKDYVIVPEYRISEHVSSYIKNGIDNEEKFDTFEIPGTGITSATSSFYKDYVNSEYLRHFRSTGEKIPGMTAKEIRISVKAVKKFNPYKGFYPAQRTLDLTAQFSASYNDSISSWIQIGGTTNYQQTRMSAVKGRALTTPLFGPGLLYNSIKSGMAVDYPITHGNAHKEALSNYPSGQDYNLNLWAVHGGDVVATSAAAVSGAWARGTTYWDQRLPFETIIAPEKHLANIAVPELIAHPSASVGVLSFTSSIQGSTTDGVYSMMASNFFGEIADFFLSDGDYTAIKSAPIAGNALTFTTGTYGARLKLYRSCAGIRDYNDEYDSNGFKGCAFESDGGKFLNVAPGEIAINDQFVTGAIYTLPQDPANANGNGKYSENFTMYSRGSAFGPACSGRDYNADMFQSGSMRGIMDSFNGYNWSFTPPYYNGEAWVDFIFRPDPGRTYTLQEVLDNIDTQYWRVDAGPQVHPTKYLTTAGPGDYPMPAFVSGNYNRRHIYDGYNVNAHAMQISASFNLWGIENILSQETDQHGVIQSARNEAKATQWIIKPKFETPMLNFNSTVQPVSVAAGTLSLPLFGSGTVPRGMWHQFGVIEPDPAKGIFVEMGDIPDNWLKYHYLINTTASIYNNYLLSGPSPSGTVTSGVSNSIRQAKQMKSLSRALNVDTRKKRLGQLATQTTVKEAVVAIPYIINNISPASAMLGTPDTELPAPQLIQQKRFFDISKKRIKAALKKNASSVEGQDLQAAGESIRKLVAKMDNYILPPQFDFLRNPNIEPIVMYMFEFSYTFDQDDLSYIWQNLAPRNYKKVTFEEQSIAHRLDQTQLLTAEALMDNDVRWMIFKVKQRATGDYYKHIPTQAGGALSFQQSRVFNPAAASDIELGLPFGSEPITSEKYRPQFNWPYDYLSFVEGIKVDVEVMFDDESNRTRSLVRELESKQTLSYGPATSIDLSIESAAAEMAATRAATATTTGTPPPILVKKFNDI